MPIKKPTGADIYEFRKTFPASSWSDVSEKYGEPLSTLKKENNGIDENIVFRLLEKDA